MRPAAVLDRHLQTAMKPRSLNCIAAGPVGPRRNHPLRVTARCWPGRENALSLAARKCGQGAETGCRSRRNPLRATACRLRASPERVGARTGPESKSQRGEGYRSSTGLVQPLIALTLRTRGHASPHSNLSGARAPVKAILVSLGHIVNSSLSTNLNLLALLTSSVCV